MVVSSVLQKLTGHLRRQALGVPLEASRTVKQTVTAFNANQGIKIEGDEETAFEAAKSKRVGLCSSSRPVAATMGQRDEAPQFPRSPRSSPRARLEFTRVEAEKCQLQSEKDRVEAGKEQLK